MNQNSSEKKGCKCNYNIVVNYCTNTGRFLSGMIVLQYNVVEIVAYLPLRNLRYYRT